MNYKDLLKSIDNNEQNICLIYGEETYTIELIIDYLKNKLALPFKEFNYTIIDDKVIDVNKMIENFEAVPFMDSNRIVVVRNNEIFKTGSKALAKYEEKKLVEYLDNPSNSTIVLFCPSEIDKRSSMYKLLNKKHVVYEADKLGQSDLRVWCIDILKKAKASIESRDLEYFIDKTGYFYKESSKNLKDLENELLKLSAIYYEKGKINAEDINLITIENFENNIFKLIDDAFLGHYKEALLGFNHMIDAGESALMVLTMIGKQLSMVIKYHMLRNKGFNESLIAQKLSVHPYALKKAISHSKKITYKEALVLLNLCLDTDYRIKNGQIQERIGVELIIAKIYQRVRINENTKVRA